MYPVQSYSEEPLLPVSEAISTQTGQSIFGQFSLGSSSVEDNVDLCGDIQEFNELMHAKFGYPPNPLYSKPGDWSISKGLKYAVFHSQHHPDTFLREIADNWAANLKNAT